MIETVDGLRLLTPAAAIGRRIRIALEGAGRFTRFSAAVAHVLTTLQVKFKGVDVLQDTEVREGIKNFSNWPTIPQLYVRGEFVGGCDIVREMAENGELQQLLDDKDIAHT